MAASSLFMATPVSRLISTTTSSPKRIANFSVRCMSSPQDQPAAASNITDATSKTPATPPPMSTPPPPAPKVKVSTKLSDLLAFSGPAPERINGRLAMIGFVSAMAVELSSGQDVFTQISNGGLAAFVATSVVFSAASLVPLLKGVRAESKSNGVMTSDAELLNGRFAMLGLIALALTEFVKGSALV